MPLRKLLPKTYDEQDTLVIMGRTAQAPLGPELSLLLWNMNKGRASNWHDDFERLKQGKDLLLLQEAVLKPASKWIFEHCEMFEWVMARSYRYPPKQSQTGVKTGAATPSLEQKGHASPDQEPFLRTPKMLLCTTYPLVDHPEYLLVINVHAINFVSVKKYARQLEQIRTAAGDHTGPLLLGGDFNNWNKARRRHLESLISDLQLEEVPLERPSDVPQHPHRMDYVFFRGLTLLRSQVHTEITSSDHYPVTVSFSTQITSGNSTTATLNR
ncbi:MAG: endonuclease/exonuclease/phosphatase family protein, partial [Planctomycetota bacterium]